ncbi:MAG: 50S ribosomal protein L18a [Thermogladius sp.]|jgi:large subunit ribosomal protein LX|uniref:Large ribosomal subunit protein eL20 n=1 Tax=Thermogladius calderae TaxID=1200300 RepID=A0A7J3XX00_9CREN|nr:50S ribosomal protein L18a [Thermogladius sp.]
MSEVKIFKVTGRMLVSHDRYPTWQKFTKEVRALTKEQALEKVYSILGSNHKLRRKHIVVEEVKEISPEEITRSNVLEFLRVERLVVG